MGGGMRYRAVIIYSRWNKLNLTHVEGNICLLFPVNMNCVTQTFFFFEIDTNLFSLIVDK
jgi:hypothetical protein